MAVEISIGGVPVPKGWHIWMSGMKPDPGRWFMEARYHHTGHWKLGYDFRPMDGAFPAFWSPPTLWKYATELESIAKVLAQPTEKWAWRLLKVHPTNVSALESKIKEDAEKAKQKKKLLFGSASGLGAQDYEITAAIPIEKFADKIPNVSFTHPGAKIGGYPVELNLGFKAGQMQLVNGVIKVSDWMLDLLNSPNPKVQQEAVADVEKFLAFLPHEKPAGV